MAVIVGRDEELAVLDSFFERPLPTALLIDGEAGIGKTILWQEGIQRAETRGYRVLCGRARARARHSCRSQRSAI